MPKVSINILTKDRAESLVKALQSVIAQTFQDFEIVVVNDGSTDDTDAVIQSIKHFNILTLSHRTSLGITASRQEALLASTGEYVAILDDDDEWVDMRKLEKQAEFLDENRDYVLVGGGIEIAKSEKRKAKKFRPGTDQQIRNWMLLKNPFFTSTVMFRKEAALNADGFIKDETDLAEDYDLWLRMGLLGKMHNFQQAFTAYHKPQYNKETFRQFLQKQLRLVERHRLDYPNFNIARIILRLRILILTFF